MSVGWEHLRTKAKYPRDYLIPAPASNYQGSSRRRWFAPRRQHEVRRHRLSLYVVGSDGSGAELGVRRFGSLGRRVLGAATGRAARAGPSTGTSCPSVGLRLGRVHPPGEEGGGKADQQCV